jgi:ribonucleoside-diphosphate reductase alpha chain
MKLQSYISTNAHNVLMRKGYYKNDEKDWDDICKRVSTAISLGDTENNMSKIEKDIYDSMNNLEFIFSSPCLLNANKDNPGQLSSCFVVGLKDNIEEICKTDAEFTKIFQRNGGAGTNISVLRPAKSKVENSNGYAGGPLCFMEKFNSTADLMTRNNPTKRGALKINLDIWHPDIIEFINCKNDTSKLTMMNISISIYNDFMEAVKNNKIWKLEFPDIYWNKDIYNEEWDGNLYAWKRKGYPTIVYKVIPAIELFNMIIEQMWKTGEPGINFQTFMNEGNMNKHLGEEVHSNPCNEFINLIYASCNLGSHNLCKMINKDENEIILFNYEKFKKNVRKSVRWMDDMISVNKLPINRIQKMTEKIRPIGMGIMGFGDLLYKLKIPYNSEKAYETAENIIKIMRDTALDSSIELAKERGTYPAWEGSEWDKQNIKIRNSSLLSLAPNGTISIIADVSGGIEPVIALVYNREIATGEKFLFVNETFKQDLINRGLYSDELINRIYNNHGSCQGIREIPEDMQKIYVTSHDISPMDHVKMVGIFQKYVDLSISKTINFNNKVSVNEIKDVVLYAFENKLKGFTVYRDGSRENQTLSTGSSYKNDNELVQKIRSRKSMGKRLEGSTYVLETACGKFYLTINRDKDNKLVETFINFKNGLCKATIDGLNRMISYSLRKGCTEEEVAEQLIGIVCPTCSRVKTKNEKEIDGISCPDIIGKILLEEYNKIHNIEKNKVSSINNNSNKCPQCGSILDHISGCIECKQCGYSKCG